MSKKRLQTDPDDMASQSLTQAEKTVAKLSRDDKNRKVSDLVLYLLIADQKKIPIKRADICKNVLKEHQKAFNIFIAEAKKSLQDVFGISLVEVDTKQKSYILVNDIDNDTDEPHLNWPAEDSAKMAMLMFSLSLIFMHGNVMVDNLLYHSLKRLGVDVDQAHEVFGDAKKLLSQEFVRQGYLEYVRQPNTDPPVYEYSWGPRAKVETSKRMVLNFVCEVYSGAGSNMDPENWTSQWQDVLRSERQAQGDDDDVQHKK